MPLVPEGRDEVVITGRPGVVGLAMVIERSVESVPAAFTA